MSKTKKFILGVAGSLAIATSLYLKVTYKVGEVIDGDTFKTEEGVHIRLSDIDAPELDACGGKEAKAALTRLIKNKRLFIKSTFTDTYGRSISYVYDGNKLVNAELVREGWGYMVRAQAADYVTISKANDYARSHKLGIFSEMCTQTQNLANPKCNIKGNVRERIGEKNYYYPGCDYYDKTGVELYLGDKWFCTIVEAEKEGFKKSGRCP